MSNQPQLSPDHMLRRTALSFVIVAGSMLAGCAGRQLMPTPNLYAQGTTDPFADVAPELRTTTVDLMYVTDRGPEAKPDGSLRYGYKRSRSIAYGSCTVRIGKDDLDWETLVHNSRVSKRDVSLPIRVVELEEKGRFPVTPFRLVKTAGEWQYDPAIEAEVQEKAAAFYDELDRRLALTSHKEVFIFVHGFNNSLDYAACTLADLWHFMGRVGVPVLYTWPAGHPGLLRGYNYDRESGEFTVYHLKQFLRALVKHPEVDGINILAHSRGTDVTTAAIRELVIETRAEGRDVREHLKIRNLNLAAADLDFEVTSQRLGAELVWFVPDRMTIYVSETDKALGLADWLFASVGRIGQTQYDDLNDDQKRMLELMETLDVIDARVKGGSFGPDNFHSSPAVSSDLILLIRDHRPPGAANGRPLGEVGPHWWVITKEYPGPAVARTAAKP